jgi:hypothetical protein
VAVPLAWQPGGARAAADGSNLVGNWTCDVDGYKEIWTIKHDTDKNEWSVTGVYQKDGQEVGSFAGRGIKLTAGGNLMLIKEYTVKPKSGWLDSVRVTITAEKDNKVVYRWTHNRSSGRRTLEPAQN